MIADRTIEAPLLSGPAREAFLARVRAVVSPEDYGDRNVWKRKDPLLQMMRPMTYPHLRPRKLSQRVLKR
ncbi:MAG: hypothetical protein RL077_2629 [Verrucomicrobiota bacterium]|jgi:hypothetical protein